MTFRALKWLLSMLVLFPAASFGGLHPATVAPSNLPWPGGVIPYVIDPALSAPMRQTYLDGFREWELAANVHFIPRTSEGRYILFKYAPGGPNLVSGSNPVTVEINLLTRGQICHETGHALGLEHEHQRANRDTFITVLYGNVVPGNNSAFDVLPGSVQFGGYDFESVMHYGRNVYGISSGVDTIQVKAGYEKYQRRLSNHTLSPVDRAHLASLYGAPAVPLSPVVTTTADAGPGSLRAAIYYVQDHPGTTVTFNIPTSDPGYSGGVFNILPTGAMPTLAGNGLVIDATTQPGYAGKPLMFLKGSSLLAEAGELPGLLFYGANNTVRGIGVRQYPWCGMVMLYPDATGNRIAGCSLGLDGAGTASAPNAYHGAMIAEGAHDNFIGGTGVSDRNFISGNTRYGVWISGATTTGNTVLGNHIGTNVSGTGAVPNIKSGIIVTDGASNNTIGGDSAAAGNVVSGNAEYGIWISGNGTAGNKLYGNRLGTSAGGSSAVENAVAGIIVTDQASGNQIGGASPGQGNVLSGNGTVGLYMVGEGTSGNLVYGNCIGTDATGMSPVPNGFAGVYLLGGCSGNYLGNGPGTGNLISGNPGVGVFVAGAATTGNFIRNNRIGPDTAGGATLPRQGGGIWFLGGAQSGSVGGATAGAANIIAGNDGAGISVYDSGTAGHTFQRNSIFDNGGGSVFLSDGTNHDQAAPEVVMPVLTTGTNLTVNLAASPSMAYTIEFYCGATGSDSGRNYIGTTTLTTNGSGSGSLNLTLPAIVKKGWWVCATATSQVTGDTSGYSLPAEVVSPDMDSDGMPDAYESVTPGLNVANGADANLDFDGDGFTNLQEFYAGTNPNGFASRLIATCVPGAGSCEVSFPSVAGRSYRLEGSETLSGAWEILAINVAGTGGTVNVTVPAPTGVSRKFFRIGPM